MSGVANHSTGLVSTLRLCFLTAHRVLKTCILRCAPLYCMPPQYMTYHSYTSFHCFIHTSIHLHSYLYIFPPFLLLFLPTTVNCIPCSYSICTYIPTLHRFLFLAIQTSFILHPQLNSYLYSHLRSWLHSYSFHNSTHTLIMSSFIPPFIAPLVPLFIPPFILPSLDEGKFTFYH